MEAAQGPILQDNDGFYDGAMVWKKTFNKVKKIVTEVPRVKRKRRKRQVKVESQHKNKHILADSPSSSTSNKENNADDVFFNEEQLQEWLPTAIRDKNVTDISRAIDITERSKPLFKYSSQEVDIFSDETDEESLNDEEEEDIKHIREYFMKSVTAEAGCQVEPRALDNLRTSEIPQSTKSRFDLKDKFSQTCSTGSAAFLFSELYNGYLSSFESSNAFTQTFSTGQILSELCDDLKLQ